MGNADLRDIAALRTVSLDDLSGVVAVDAHNWLYRYLTTTVRFTADEAYTTADGREVANLIGIAQGLPNFFEHDLTPVFVFDGGVTELKDEEVQRRREQREAAEERREAAEERGDTVEAARLAAQTQRLTQTIQETSRELLELLDVPVVEAPAEGEAQAAHMNATGAVDYVGSEDYDVLLFGGPRTIRKLTGSDDPEVMDLSATLERHDLTREQLIDAAMLCGTDFNEGVSGVGPKTAVRLLDEHGDLFTALEAEGATVANADAVRQFFRDPPVTDATFDTTVSPDVEAARAYVTDEWEVPASEVEAGFDRLSDALTQTGLDDWT
ncbi:flap endonuclease-1 [Halobaculum sp. MBLA0143]|uniref:flap endonuclease-1 n=1 Tax=Halobaculum sp. MBLA0143 TaxID=3079933 RepID=UPI003523658F